MKTIQLLISILLIFFLLSPIYTKGATERAEEVIDTVKETLQKGKHVVEETLSEAGDYIKEALTKGKKGAEDSVEGLKNTGKRVKDSMMDSAETLEKKAKENMGDLKAKIDDLGTGASKAGENLKEYAKEKFENLKEGIGLGADKAKKVGENLKEKLKDDTVENMAKDAKRAGEEALQKGKGKFETIKEKIGDTIETIEEKFEGAKEAIFESAQGLKDKVMGAKDAFMHKGDKLKDEAADAAYDLKDSVVDSKNKATRKAKDLGDSVQDLYENARDQLLGSVKDLPEMGQDLIDQGKDKAQEVKDKAQEVIKDAKRKWEGVSKNLEPLYEKGWEKLDMLFKHGQLPEFKEFKEMLGNKFDEFSEMMKPGQAKDKIKKKIEDKKIPDNMREFYDQMWNKIEEVFKSGTISYDDLKSLFFEKTDDLKKAISDFVDKNVEVDSKTNGIIDEEINRVKGLILNWKDKFCDNCGHKKSLWESIRDVFSNWGQKASNTWNEVKEKVSSSKEPQQPVDPNAKSSDL